MKVNRNRLYKATSLLTAIIFALTFVVPPSFSAEKEMNMPAPGAMVTLSSSYNPPSLMGLKLFPEQPLKFDFFIDEGDDQLSEEVFQDETRKLVKYFLAALTIPEQDMWVNLNPFEQDKISTEKLGVTEMGRDLLSQDYVLKQLTASLIYPEEDLGKEFWDRVYKKTYEIYGKTDIPVNTFNKVWVIPDEAVVYVSGDTAVISNSKLKVMLEEDYLVLNKNLGNRDKGMDQLAEKEATQISNVSSSIVKEVILPEIEKEVNEGKNFAPLRQIYNSLVLATWYKSNLKESLLSKAYADKNKVYGVNVDDKKIKDKIYDQYMDAYKKGVYNYIREDYDPYTEQNIARNYFSGGANFRGMTETSRALYADRMTPRQKTLQDRQVQQRYQGRRIRRARINVNPSLDANSRLKIGDRNISLAVLSGEDIDADHRYNMAGNVAVIAARVNGEIRRVVADQDLSPGQVIVKNLGQGKVELRVPEVEFAQEMSDSSRRQVKMVHLDQNDRVIDAVSRVASVDINNRSVNLRSVRDLPEEGRQNLASNVQAVVPDAGGEIQQVVADRDLKRGQVLVRDIGDGKVEISVPEAQFIQPMDDQTRRGIRVARIESNGEVRDLSSISTFKVADRSVVLVSDEAIGDVQQVNLADNIIAVASQVEGGDLQRVVADRNIASGQVVARDLGNGQLEVRVPRVEFTQRMSDSARKELKIVHIDQDGQVHEAARVSRLTVNDRPVNLVSGRDMGDIGRINLTQNMEAIAPRIEGELARVVTDKNLGPRQVVARDIGDGNVEVVVPEVEFTQMMDDNSRSQIQIARVDQRGEMLDAAAYEKMEIGARSVDLVSARSVPQAERVNLSRNVEAMAARIAGDIQRVIPDQNLGFGQALIRDLGDGNVELRVPEVQFTQTMGQAALQEVKLARIDLAGQVQNPAQVSNLIIDDRPVDLLSTRRLPETEQVNLTKNVKAVAPRISGDISGVVLDENLNTGQILVRDIGNGNVEVRVPDVQFTGQMNSADRQQIQVAGVRLDRDFTDNAQATTITVNNRSIDVRSGKRLTQDQRQDLANNVSAAVAPRVSGELQGVVAVPNLNRGQILVQDLGGGNVEVRVPEAQFVNMMDAAARRDVKIARIAQNGEVRSAANVTTLNINNRLVNLESDRTLGDTGQANMARNVEAIAPALGGDLGRVIADPSLSQGQVLVRGIGEGNLEVRVPEGQFTQTISDSARQEIKIARVNPTGEVRDAAAYQRMDMGDRTVDLIEATDLSEPARINLARNVEAVAPRFGGDVRQVVADQNLSAGQILVRDIGDGNLMVRVPKVQFAQPLNDTDRAEMRIARLDRTGEVRDAAAYQRISVESRPVVLVSDNRLAEPNRMNLARNVEALAPRFGGDVKRVVADQSLNRGQLLVKDMGNGDVEVRVPEGQFTEIMRGEDRQDVKVAFIDRGGEIRDAAAYERMSFGDRTVQLVSNRRLPEPARVNMSRNVEAVNPLVDGDIRRIVADRNINRGQVLVRDIGGGSVEVRVPENQFSRPMNDTVRQELRIATIDLTGEVRDASKVLRLNISNRPVSVVSNQEIPQAGRANLTRNIEILAPSIKGAVAQVVTDQNLSRGQVIVSSLGEGKVGVRVPEAQFTGSMSSQNFRQIKIARLDTDSRIKSPDRKGGIDFNPNLIELAQTGEGLSPVVFKNLPNVDFDGLVPIIEDTAPVDSLPDILGKVTASSTDNQISLR